MKKLISNYFFLDYILLQTFSKEIYVLILNIFIKYLFHYLYSNKIEVTHSALNILISLKSLLIFLFHQNHDSVFLL